jgi:alkylated DNA repair dioxygenase AlkB
MFKMDLSTVSSKMTPIKIELPELPTIDYRPNFLDKDLAKVYYDKLASELNFKADSITFGDKTIESKRKYSFHGSKSYSYSGVAHDPNGWTETLKELCVMVERETGYEFNSVLANYYENGEAGMGWHADKERELGFDPIIASLSLGATRKFAFRHRKELVNLKNPPRLCEYDLDSGTLLIMEKGTQPNFEHSVIKNKGITEGRINLTFRKIV